MTQNKLPKDWKIVISSEIMDIRDGTHDTPKYINENGIPLITSKNLKGNKIDFNKVNYISTEDHFEISKRSKVESGDILFAMIGTIGNPAIIKDNDNFSIKNVGLFKKNEGSILPQFFVNFLRSSFFEKQLNERKLLKGTTQKFIPLGNLRKIEIPLPSIEIQHLIVSKIEELFSKLDKGIEDLKTAQQQLKIYRQSVLKFAFEGRLTNKKVKKGELPKGWEWKKIKDICDIKGGKNQSKIINPEGKYPIYGSSGIFGYGDEYICDANTTIIGRKGNINSPIYVTTKFWNVDTAFGLCTNEKYDSKLLFYFCLGFNFKKLDKSTTIPSLAKTDILSIDIQQPPINEQLQIVKEIESRLSVADKMDESITQSLQQAEALRQSILKKAFSGELIKDVVQEKIYKPKNQYFFQMQIIGKVASISKKNKIEHGEMTIAKYTYLADKLFGIPTGFEFNRWHLGPYPPAIKKVVNNKQYFQRSGNHIEVINESTLFKSTNDYTSLIDDAVSNLVGIFSKYKTPAERAHKTELLATVCKVIEDIKTTDLLSVRTSMKEWKIDLKTSTFKNKAEKFNEDETKSCIGFIVDKGWDEKLIS